MFDTGASRQQKERTAGQADIDRGTMLLGLLGDRSALSVRCPGDPVPESTLAAERAVFALQFRPRLAHTDQRRPPVTREKLDDERPAFSHMVADYKARGALIDEKGPER